MFISDEVRAEASPAAVAARLAVLARGSALAQMSHAAWGTKTAAVDPDSAEQELSKLIRVRCQDPVQRGAIVVLILRWEAVGQSGPPFPALDADITVMPDGDQAVLVGLTGVYRTPAETPDQPGVGMAAAIVIRAFLTRIAAAISDPPLLPPGGHQPASAPAGCPGWTSTPRRQPGHLSTV